MPTDTLTPPGTPTAIAWTPCTPPVPSPHVVTTIAGYHTGQDGMQRYATAILSTGDVVDIRLVDIDAIVFT